MLWEGFFVIGWGRHLTGEELLGGFFKGERLFCSLFLRSHRKNHERKHYHQGCSLRPHRWYHKVSYCPPGLKVAERTTLEHTVYTWNLAGGMSLWWDTKGYHPHSGCSHIYCMICSQVPPSSFFMTLPSSGGWKTSLEGSIQIKLHRYLGAFCIVAPEFLHWHSLPYR